MRENRWQEAEQAALAVLANAGSNVSLFEARDIARNTLINTYERTGRLEEAERIARDTVQEQLMRLGDDHPETLVSEHSLAMILVGAGKLVDAEQLFRKALAGEERVLGEAHEQTARTRGWLACVLLKSGQRAAALALERENLEHGQRVPASSRSCIFMNTDPDVLQLVEDSAHPKSQ